MKHLPPIFLFSIPHHKQRYETSGDYYKDGDVTQFNVSESRPDFEILIAIHELVEWYLITKRGVKIREIDAFDKAYEAKRLPGDLSEPGDDKSAPYYREHQIASAIERALAVFLGVDWHEYEETIAHLPYATPRGQIDRK